MAAAKGDVLMQTSARANPRGDSADWGAMKRHRERIPASIGIEIDPLYSFGKHGRLGQLKESLGISGAPAKSRGPVLMLSEPYYNKFGPEAQADGEWVVSLPLLTVTAKMGCMSFSLPAGPMASRGTCPMAQQRTTRQLAEGIDPDDLDAYAQELRMQFLSAPSVKVRDWAGNVIGEGPPAYICDGCYAGKNLYKMLPINAMKASWRLAWVNAALKRPGNFFVNAMVKALQHTYHLPATTQASLRVNGKYFRWHDAGDVWSRDYWEAIKWIAELLPHITFWMPTRQWAAPAWAKLFSAPMPPNLIVRPSALFVDAPGPMLPGMAAGTMVTSEPVGSLRAHRQAAGDPFPGPSVGVPADPHKPKGARLFPERRVVPVVENEVWDCPAYLGDTDKAKSCLVQKCRVCWTRPDVVVGYGNH